MKEILLNKEFIALVDDEDYDYINQWHWTAVKDNYTYYARRGERINGKKKNFAMHRIIMGRYQNINGEIVDHTDHNGLNNQKKNLRMSGNSGNSFNKLKSTKTSKPKSSIYKGVSYMKRSGLYKALIIKNYKQIFIGEFKDEIDAAIGYDIYAVDLFGEFACLNFPNTLQEERNRVKKIIDSKRLIKTSKFKGVSFIKKTGKWIAKCKIGTFIYLGTFENEIDAAIAYQTHVKSLN